MRASGVFTSAARRGRLKTLFRHSQKLFLRRPLRIRAIGMDGVRSVLRGKRAQVFVAVEQSFDRRLVADADDQGVGQFAFEQG